MEPALIPRRQAYRARKEGNEDSLCGSEKDWGLLYFVSKYSEFTMPGTNLYSFSVDASKVVANAADKANPTKELKAFLDGISDFMVELLTSNDHKQAQFMVDGVCLLYVEDLADNVLDKPLVTTFNVRHLCGYIQTPLTDLGW